MLSTLATEVLVEDRHRELRAGAARHEVVHRMPRHPAVRAWVGWMLMRTGWRLAASARRTSVTILGRTTL